MMLFKQISQDVKDINEEKGIVEAFANVYDFEDSDGDISAKGSFNRTVNNNFKRIRVLKDHNPQISLGVPLKIDADNSYGLFTVSKFNLNKEVSRDMFTDIKLMVENGLSAELSIGYERDVKRDTSDRRRITEYKLMEYSFLTSWAANELSTVSGVKSLKSHYGVMELLSKMYDLPYSDIRLKNIEAILKSLTDDPSDKLDTQIADPIDANLIKSIFETTLRKI